jgi:hypothetical protein
MSHGRSEIKKSARRGKEMGTAGQGSVGRNSEGDWLREVETGVEACGGVYVGPWAASFRKGLLVLERSAAYKETENKKMGKKAEPSSVSALCVRATRARRVSRGSCVSGFTAARCIWWGPTGVCWTSGMPVRCYGLVIFFCYIDCRMPLIFFLLICLCVCLSLFWRFENIYFELNFMLNIKLYVFFETCIEE